MIASQQLRLIAPLCIAPDQAALNLNTAMSHYGIDRDVEQVRALIAQLCVESNQFNSTIENLNYGAIGLMNTWPKRFPTLDVAKFYERKPELIANHVYADRMGNGNEASGDGWTHRGRGWMQVTGKTAQLTMLRALGLPAGRVELLSESRWAAFSACQFWVDHNCAELKNDVVALTERINGGHHGLEARKAFWNKTKLVIP